MLANAGSFSTSVIYSS